MSGGYRAAGIRASAVGTQQDRRRIRRLAGKRTGPCIGARAPHEHGGRVSAFRAVPEPLRVRDAWDPQPEIDEGVAQARQGLAELGDLDPYAASADDAAEALARYGASVDLLVVGSHEYRPIDHLLSGSTAQRPRRRRAVPAPRALFHSLRDPLTRDPRVVLDSVTQGSSRRTRRDVLGRASSART